jgi:hypothetical protein
MTWMEMIELRTTERNRQALEEELEAWIRDVGAPQAQMTCRVFRRSYVETDYCIQILHGSGDVKSHGSRLGLLMASTLRTHGLVSHRIWIPMEHEA